MEWCLEGIFGMIVGLSCRVWPHIFGDPQIGFFAHFESGAKLFKLSFRGFIMI